jgi:predicted DNA-binding transcriptional regulator AlpA
LIASCGKRMFFLLLQLYLQEEQMDFNELLTLEEVAELTRLPIATLRYYRQRRIGPPMFRLGRRLVAHKAEVVAWIEEQHRLGLGA